MATTAHDLRRRTARFELIMGAVALLLTGYGAFTFGRWAAGESTVEMTLTFGVLLIAGAIETRLLYATYVQHEQLPKSRRRVGPPRPRWILLLPLASTLVMSPLIWAGALDPEMAPAMSLFLYLVLAHTCLLAGILVCVFVLVPLELVGRGLLGLLGGDRRAGGLVLMGLWLGLIAVFAVVGALALGNLPPPAFAPMAILAALFGLDGNYTVRSPLLLWVTRIIGIVLVAPILAAWAASLRAEAATEGDDDAD